MDAELKHLNYMHVYSDFVNDGNQRSSRIPSLRSAALEGFIHNLVILAISMHKQCMNWGTIKPCRQISINAVERIIGGRRNAHVCESSKWVSEASVNGWRIAALEIELADALSTETKPILHSEDHLRIRGARICDKWHNHLLLSFLNSQTIHVQTNKQIVAQWCMPGWSALSSLSQWVEV